MTTNDRVLIIDDDPSLLAGLVRHFENRYSLETAACGEEALVKVKASPPFAAVVCDMRMPGMDGIETIRNIAELSPNSVLMMLTGNADQKTAMDAINRGSIFRFFNKPTPISVFGEGIDAAILQYSENYRIMEIRTLLEKTLAGCVALLTDVLAMVAPDSFHRAQRLRSWAAILARHMKLADPWVLELATGLVHLGAIAVPPEVLARHHAGKKLSPVEEDVIARIPEIGASLIRKVPRLEPVADAVQNQAVWFCGARVTDAGLHGRILHALLQIELAGCGTPSREALAVLEQQTGRFDPAVLTAIRSCLVDAVGPMAEGAEVHLDVPVTGIRVGDTLESDLNLKNGRLVLAFGETVTDLLFLRLQNLHLTNPLIEPIRVRRSAAQR